MFKKFINFWRILFKNVRMAYNKAFKEPLLSMTQEWRDVKHTNFLAIFVDKLSNLANTEATFEIVTDSAQAEPLADLLADMESRRYEIASEMLGSGDYYVFPATGEDGTLRHTYLTQQQVRILNMDGEKITEAFGIIDWYDDSLRNKLYYLLRHHRLDENGTLFISYYVTDSEGKPAIVGKWQPLVEEQLFAFKNANNIGFSRFKSPASSRGLSPVYGVPLNFGCEEIEKRIFNDLQNTDEEFKNAASKIFTDPRNLVQDERGSYRFLDNIFAVQSRAGQNGSNIDIYAPEIRYNEYRAKYIDDLMQYEQQVGVDRGFLTPMESGAAVTATEIRRANASTISTIEKIHAAMAKGIEDTMKTDAMYLNIAEDLYAVKIDWYDPFEDADAQWSRLVEAHGAGAIETEDLTAWLFPNLTPEQIAEKLERIGEKTAANTDEAINRILMGQ